MILEPFTRKAFIIRRRDPFLHTGEESGAILRHFFADVFIEGICQKRAFEPTLITRSGVQAAGRNAENFRDFLRLLPLPHLLAAQGDEAGATGGIFHQRREVEIHHEFGAVIMVPLHTNSGDAFFLNAEKIIKQGGVFLRGEAAFDERGEEVRL